LHSRLRLITAAYLCVLGALIGVGALVLLPAALRQVPVAPAEISDGAAIACKQQTWFHFDRNCLSRRGMPWMADPQASKNATVEVPSAATEGAAAAAEGAANERRDENEQTAAVPQEPAAPQEPVRETAVATEREAIASQPLPANPSVAEVPPTTDHEPEQASTENPRGAAPPQDSVQKIDTTTAPGTTAAPTVGQARPVATPSVHAQARSSGRKEARRPRAAREPKNEALNSLKRFGDNLPDIPVSAYAADGAQRRIVIHPTSIQDVYYYSTRR
jgi:hypothetical protein